MLDALYDFWIDSETEFRQLAGKDLWQYENHWRNAFASRYHAATGEQPRFRTEDELQVVLSTRYQEHSVARATAETEYAKVQSGDALEYVVFTLNNIGGFYCRGRLPPRFVLVETANCERKSGRNVPAFLFSDVDFTWTTLFSFGVCDCIFVARRLLLAPPMFDVVLL